MLQCTRVSTLPVGELAAELLAAGHQPVEQFRTYTGACLYVWCELGEHSDGKHADLISEEDVNGEYLWFLWDDNGGHRFEYLPACVADAPDGDDVCHFFRQHPGDHSWKVTDPVMDAMRSEVKRQMRGWQSDG
ncbi:hypothetical protein SAZ11_39055 [Streptomyces sp. FXJ1.4098]|uniref:hypothetical protein n=1 Tax=Streptomyces sp. NPDC020845 TaxID=3365096 RepID=UPI00299155F9|nr:hypothetical protein [Streptomyces sp. FXJ1.4098]